MYAENYNKHDNNKVENHGTDLYFCDYPSWSAAEVPEAMEFDNRNFQNSK